MPTAGRGALQGIDVFGDLYSVAAGPVMPDLLLLTFTDAFQAAFRNAALRNFASLFLRAALVTQSCPAISAMLNPARSL